ncbi:hypothetical protein HYU22_01045 [Candidatus Woesearchaeota archaeon]|nr:hypothetical protein [Candidatus Woesearchaeota archaeon]
MGLENIVQRLNRTIIMPVVVAGTLLTSAAASAEPEPSYSPSAEIQKRSYAALHHRRLVPDFNLDALAQNVPTNEDDRPRTYYINPNSPSTTPEEPAPPYLQSPPPTGPASSYSQQPSPANGPLPPAEPRRNTQNDSLGYVLIVTGALVTLISVPLVTDGEVAVCSGHSSSYSCRTDNSLMELGVVGVVVGLGTAGLGIYMLVD